jgi:hypothetical protein
MFNVFSRPKSALVTVPAVEATAETSSDTILIERIAAGDKLAMQVLFARHRTPVYRWLYRFVGNETVAEDLLSDVFFDVWQQAAGLKDAPPFRLGSSRSPASRRSPHAAAGPMPS